MMTRIDRCSIVLALVLAIAPLADALADTPVWKVSRGDRYLYIAGTVHILSERDYPLPVQFDKAYVDSDAIAIEVDVDRLSQPRVQNRIFENSTYPEGQSLKDEISSETLHELSRYCAIRELSLAQLVRFRPGAVASIMTSVEFDRLALNKTGVDAHFLARARVDDKPVLYLDSVQTQFQLSMSLNQGNPDQVIRYALANIFNDAAWLAKAKSAWRNGDLRGLEALAVTPMLNDSPDVYDAVLAERNHDWIPKIERMLNDERIELVLFGAAHLPGPDGVLPLLRKRGYKVETFY